MWTGLPLLPYLGRMRLTPECRAVALLALVACHRQPVAVAPAAPTLPPAIPPLVGPEQVGVALRWIERAAGTGEAVVEKRCVFVHYTGWLRDGTKFDSSRDTTPTGEPRLPLNFPVAAGRVIPGWDYGFDGMRVGGARRLFIPFQFAYGEAGRPPVIPPRSALIFDIEVMAVSDTLPSAPNRPGRPGAQCPTWAAVSDTTKR